MEYSKLKYGIYTGVFSLTLLSVSCSGGRSFFASRSVERHDPQQVTQENDSLFLAVREPETANKTIAEIFEQAAPELIIDTLPLTPVADSIPSEELDLLDSSDEDAVWGTGYEFSDKELTTVGVAGYDVFNGENMIAVSLDEIKQNGVYPFGGILSSQYGVRRGRIHSGIDISARNGATDIFAVMDGVVRLSMYMKGYGNLIVIRHENGLESLYSHNKTNLVKSGDIVKAGDQIAIVGQTGKATGPHLHFEFRLMGKALDPNLFLDPKESTFREGSVYLHKYPDRIIASKEQDRSKIVIHRYHKVRSGDTLSAIARRYGVTLKQLCAMNKITTKTILRIGTSLKVS